jgi:glutaconyl-CoA/methylmalonyl-CoA decarboxylase subunit delta
MENIPFGLNITAVGMGLVFALLLLLWLVLFLIGKLDNLSFMQEEEAPAEDEDTAGSLRVTGRHAQDLEPEVLTAIAVAIAAHVAMRRRQAAPSMRMTVPGSQIFASRWLAAGRTRQTGGWTPKG